MNLLILPDIFGATPALTRLALDLEKNIKGSVPDLCTTLFDPYGNGTFFEDERQAYTFFTDRLGIPAYAARIGRHLNKAPGTHILLAFSAGASALWHLAGTAPCPGVIGAVGFYGSQIRHHTDLVPGVDMHLIFPEFEPHFDVDNLMTALSGTPRTFCEKAPGRHGFMNRFSDHFDEDLYTVFTRERLPDLLASMMRAD